MVMKKILIALALLLTGIASGSACTGISFLAEDGGYVQARTIEWGNSYLPSEYVIVPRGQDLVSYTPTGVNGLRFRAKYGLVGLAIIQKEFVAEGLNEVGLSLDCFICPIMGSMKNMMRLKMQLLCRIAGGELDAFPICYYRRSERSYRRGEGGVS